MSYDVSERAKLPSFMPSDVSERAKLPSFMLSDVSEGAKLPSFMPSDVSEGAKLPSFGLSAYRFPLMASTMFIREARQAGMPALSRFISRQKRKAARKIQGLSRAPAVRLVSPAK